MKKKKVLIVALVICLLAILSYGTLAWFTAEDEVTNEFTIGSVDIEVKEEFTPPEAMLPIVNVDNPAADDNYINKDVWVANTGKNLAYIQVFIAVPKALDDAGAFHYEEVNENSWNEAGPYVAEIDGIAYNVYRYRYYEAVEPENTTKYVITGAYLDAKLDVITEEGVTYFTMDGEKIEGYVVGETIEILVAAQAIQSEGFTDKDSALDTFVNHPWATTN